MQVHITAVAAIATASPYTGSVFVDNFSQSESPNFNQSELTVPIGSRTNDLNPVTTVVQHTAAYNSNKGIWLKISEFGKRLWYLKWVF